MLFNIFHSFDIFTLVFVELLHLYSYLYQLCTIHFLFLVFSNFPKYIFSIKQQKSNSVIQGPVTSLEVVEGQWQQQWPWLPGQ